MHWFGGTIAEAVTLSKQKNAIFVVFVEGENDLSKELAETIDNESVLTRLSNSDKFLAIKLKSGTDNYTYFAQIYQFVPVPSLFFIGRNGTPLEVVCAGIEAQNLASRIDLIIEEHCKEGTASLLKPSTSAQSVKEQTQSLLQSEADVSGPKPSGSAEPAPPPVAESLKKPSTDNAVGPAAKVQKTDKPQEYEVVCEGDVCVRRPKEDLAGTSNDTTTPQPAPEPAAEPAASVEAKMDRAKELIEIKKREKAEKEKELERQRELERRSVGQGVAELKRWQAEQELKQIQEERKREKAENALARQRILDQIAQDRAERRAREARAAPPPAQAQAQPQAVDAGECGGASGAGAGAATARLQLKLPDGGAHTAQFPAAATLADVCRYIADNLQLPSSQFSLWTAFPRRELTEADATLAALGLAPSAALLLLPRAQPPARTAPSPASLIAFLTQLFTTMIVDPTYRVYNWLRQQLFPRGAGGGGAAQAGGEARAGGERGVAGGRGAGGVRRRGNVHRLAGDHDDDDNNTWNGNSTQQM